MNSMIKEHKVLQTSGVSFTISQASLHRLQGLLKRIWQASMLSKRPSIHMADPESCLLWLQKFKRLI